MRHRGLPGRSQTSTPTPHQIDAAGARWVHRARSWVGCPVVGAGKQAVEGGEYRCTLWLLPPVTSVDSWHVADGRRPAASNHASDLTYALLATKTNLERMGHSW